MDLTTSANGTTMGISILVDKETTEGVVHVKATDPKGTASEMDLIYDYKNKTYNINLPVSEVGKYTLEATYSEKDASGNYQKSKQTPSPSTITSPKNTMYFLQQETTPCSANSHVLPPAHCMLTEANMSTR